MQKQQHLTVGGGGARVHLPRPSAPGRQHAIRERLRACARIVTAAAVDDDDFMTRLPQACERRQGGSQTFGFVDNRNDDGKLGNCRCHRAQTCVPGWVCASLNSKRRRNYCPALPCMHSNEPALQWPGPLPLHS